MFSFFPRFFYQALHASPIRVSDSFRSAELEARARPTSSSFVLMQR